MHLQSIPFARRRRLYCPKGQPADQFCLEKEHHECPDNKTAEQATLTEVRPLVFTPALSRIYLRRCSNLPKSMIWLRLTCRSSPRNPTSNPTSPDSLSDHFFCNATPASTVSYQVLCFRFGGSSRPSVTPILRCAKTQKTFCQTRDQTQGESQPSQ